MAVERATKLAATLISLVVYQKKVNDMRTTVDCDSGNKSVEMNI